MKLCYKFGALRALGRATVELWRRGFCLTWKIAEKVHSTWHTRHSNIIVLLANAFSMLGPSSSLCPSVFVRTEENKRSIEADTRNRAEGTKSMLNGKGKAKKQFWGFLFYLRATNEQSVNVLLDVEGMFSIPLDSACTNCQINFRKFPQKCRHFLCFPSKEHVINIFGNKNNCH